MIVAPTGDDGMPKLDELVAFRCRGDQAVTYAPGTWHAPMVAVGGRIDFCVLVAENGVQDEDLQEVLIGGEGVRVQVVDEQGNWGLWEK